MSGSPWPMVRLGEVLERVERFEDRDPLKDYKFAGTYSYARGIFVSGIKAGASFKLPRIQRVYEGDFVYCKIMAWEGAFGLVPAEAHNCVMSGAFVAYRIDKSKVLPEFLGYYFKIPDVWKTIGGQSSGTNVRRQSLHPSQFEGAFFPLPPLAEQWRIVARIEELAAKVEEARRLREEIEQTRGMVRDSVLTTIVKETDWQRIALANLLREPTQNGLSQRPSDSPDGVPILRISAATSREDGIVDELDTKFILIDGRTEQKYKLNEGDLLACRFNGNLRFVGKVALYQGTQRKTVVYPDKLIRLRVDGSRVLPEFLRDLLNGPIGRQEIERHCQSTAGNIGISARDLVTVTVPIPSLSEQHRLVQMIKVIQSHVSMSGSLAREQNLGTLVPAMLDVAFKGKW